MLDVIPFIYYNYTWYENMKILILSLLYRFEKNQGGGYQ